MLKSNVDQSVIVSTASFDSDDPYRLISSNIDFLNGLFERHFRDDELSTDALYSYWVDYYLAQVYNGGFSQFVYNSRWDASVVRCVLKGLEAMGASKHLALFHQCAQILDRIGPDEMQKYFDSEYFNENEERDLLNEFDESFVELQDEEDLILLNSNWLRGLTNLVVLSDSEIDAEIDRRVAALPDFEERAAKALADEPRYMKLIRALCIAAGCQLDRVTAGDPTFEYAGRKLLSWHFLTDTGHYHMADFDGKALMFKGHTTEIVCEIEASDEFGSE